MKAFILAAGFGTRLRPITNFIPKPIIPIFDKTPLEICADRIKKTGISDISINVHHLSNMIIEFLKTKKLEFNISVEKECILGVGGGIGKLKKYFYPDDVVVYNADIISDIDLNILIEYHSSRKNWATLALVKNKETDGVLIDEESNIIEFNSQSKIGYTFSGISVISKEIYEQLPEKIYFNIIDLYKEIIKSDNNKKIKGFFLGDNLWSDIGSPESYWNLVCRIFSDNNLLGKFNISKFGNENLEIFKNQKSIFIDSEIKKEIINSIIFQNKKVL